MSRAILTELWHAGEHDAKQKPGPPKSSSPTSNRPTSQNHLVQCCRSLMKQTIETLETLTKQMAIAVTRCSRDFRYLWANQLYADWIRRPLNEIVDRPISIVLGK